LLSALAFSIFIVNSLVTRGSRCQDSEGEAPESRVVWCKILCCKIAVKLLGVWLEPLIPSRAQLRSLFAIRKIRSSKAWCLPYVVGGLRVVLCLAAFVVGLFLVFFVLYHNG
jgi:hypothetical protein